jgi:hypothetical protein
MTQHVDDLPPDRADKLERIRVIREQMEALETEYDELRDEVIADLNEPVFIAGADGHKYRVSKVEGSQPVFHVEQLRRVPEELIPAITETKIVGAKLKAEVQAGRLDPEIAMHLVSYVPKRAYPKFDPAD